MTFEMLLVVGVLICIFVVLTVEWLATDVAFMGGVAVVVAAGVLPAEEALDGFANTTLVALGSLYIVAAALESTGALATAGQFILGKARDLRTLLVRLFVVVSSSSAFLNNTPIVAMGIPAVEAWSEDNDVASSKLLIPLSFASIFGGACTLIGTSTNLVVDGLLRSHEFAGFGFFELAWIGLPCALAGSVFLVLLGPLLLPERQPLYAPEVGEHEEMRRRRRREEGLSTDDRREEHHVVVPEGSGLIGQRIDQTDLDERFNAVVLEIVRNGRELTGDVRQSTIHAGDTLILDTGAGFRGAFGHADDFYVTTRPGGVTQSEPPAEVEEIDRRGAWFAAGILLAIVVAAASGIVHISIAALIGAAILIASDAITPEEARAAVDWEVLIVIGASLGLGKAMEISGAAQLVAQGLIGIGDAFGPIGIATSVVLGTSVLTQIITNNGAVALMFPIALSVAQTRGLPIRPLVIGITVAGSLSFITPLGYQTNLMVYSAGNYRFSDFFRIGIPLQILVLGVIIATLALGWQL
ncbi:MAG: SLC13 family permease [Bradymonadaceae bacterium]